MSDERSLRDLCPGEWAVVSRLENPGGMRRRLLDIGLIEGTRVGCVGRAPSGDPTAFLIRGAVIALRREDCRHIGIKEAAAWD